MKAMTQRIENEEYSLDAEIKALIEKAVREGLSDSEFARFQHLTAERSLSKRPRFAKRVVFIRNDFAHAV